MPCDESLPVSANGSRSLAPDPRRRHRRSPRMRRSCRTDHADVALAVVRRVVEQHVEHVADGIGVDARLAGRRSTISRRPLARHRVLPVATSLAAEPSTSQSTSSRSVWRASASRLLIVDSSRSSWPRLSCSTADGVRPAARRARSRPRLAWPPPACAVGATPATRTSARVRSSSSMRAAVVDQRRAQRIELLDPGRFGRRLLGARARVGPLLELFDRSVEAIGRRAHPQRRRRRGSSAPPRPAAPAIGSSASGSRCRLLDPHDERRVRRCRAARARRRRGRRRRSPRRSCPPSPARTIDRASAGPVPTSSWPSVE